MIDMVVIYLILFFTLPAFAETDCESLRSNVHKNISLLNEAENNLEDLYSKLEDNQKGFEVAHKNLVLLLEAEDKVIQAKDILENSRAVYMMQCSDYEHLLPSGD